MSADLRRASFCPRAIRPALALAVSCLALAAVAPASHAQAVLPDDPSLDQYIESVPSPDGRHAAGPNRGAGAPLPPGVHLRSNRNDRLLKRVVTSSALGAPSASEDRKAREGRSRHGAASGAAAPRKTSIPGPESSAAALTGTVTGSQGLTIPLLVGMLALIFVALAVPAVRRSRDARHR